VRYCEFIIGPEPDVTVVGEFELCELKVHVGICLSSIFDTEGHWSELHSALIETKSCEFFGYEESAHQTMLSSFVFILNSLRIYSTWQGRGIGAKILDIIKKPRC
jgi:hypothetical protein